MTAAAAAQQSATAAASAGKGAIADGDDDEMPELEGADEEAGPTDEGELDPKEIETVMAQVCIALLIVVTLCSLVVLRQDAPERKPLLRLSRAVAISSMPVRVYLCLSTSPILTRNASSHGSEWIVFCSIRFPFSLFPSFLQCHQNIKLLICWLLGVSVHCDITTVFSRSSQEGVSE
jgi:hypothetical protein